MPDWLKELLLAVIGSASITGGIGWVTVCMGAGFLFGNVPIIKENFTLVTIGIVFVSILPMVFEVIKHRNLKSRN